jgi:hypothetical protein
MTTADEIRSYFREQFNTKKTVPSTHALIRKFAPYDPRQIRKIIAALKNEMGIIQNDPTKEGPRVRAELGIDSGWIEVTGFNVISPEQALEMAKIDTEKWEISKVVTNSWQTTLNIKSATGSYEKQVTNHQIKVIVTPKIPNPLVESLKSLIADIPKWKSPERLVRRVPSGDYALEVANFDAHMGKYAWNKETGMGDYDVKIGSETILNATVKNLNYASSFPISRVFYVLGQDLLHVENVMGQTPMGGNKLDVDCRLPKIYQVTKETVLKSIRLCLEVAPVTVIWIPGNHDYHISYYLADVVKEHFRLDKNVFVDEGEERRKAFLWGNLMVGFTHDASTRQGAIINTLPQFWPEMWAQSKYREWHVGHKHKKEETKYSPTKTVGGVIIRQIPALSPIDFWHYENNFVDAVPAGEAMVWSKDSGIVAHFTANVDH